MTTSFTACPAAASIAAESTAAKPSLRVSFVIPAHNEQAMLTSLLDSIRRLQPAEGMAVFEVIVADADSTDATADLARAAGCHVVKAERGAASVARNAGGAVARGDVLAFIDADCLLPADWLQGVAEVLADGNVVAVSAAMSPPQATESWVARAWHELTVPEARDRDAAWLPSFNLAVRAQVFRDVGGFDESLVTCEDVELSLRLRRHGRLRNTAGAAVAHSGSSQSLSEFFRREAWRSRGALTMLRRYWHDPREVVSTMLPFLVTIGAALTLLCGLAAVARVPLISNPSAVAPCGYPRPAT
jgi:glycosyltransferase involved in cell wall biosynthesis